jgi:hypothetical protein
MSAAAPMPALSQLPTDDDATISSELVLLERWAKDNRRDADRDRTRFWALKLPAIVCAATISALEGFGYHAAVSILGAASAICVACDAAFPGGLLHNVHKRAFNELRKHALAVKTKWDIARYSTSAGTPERRDAVVSILVFSEQERSRISDYITVAEASLGEKR